MMDSRYDRTPFHDYIERARSEAIYGKLNAASTNATAALEYLTKLKNVTESDYRKAADVCHEIANKYFNVGNYAHAADYYQHGIQNRLDIEKALTSQLTDRDYRHLAELFIDQSDAYMHLFNQEAANNAFSNAIKAFNLIKSKTDEELEAAKSAANDNYAAFHILYEKKLSQSSYIKSSEFHNHEKIIYQHQEDKQIESLLDDMTLSPEIRDQEKMEDMMEGLTFTVQSSHTFFSQPNADKEPSDNEYRTMGNKLISFANNQHSQQSKDNTIATLQQATSAFNKIRRKTDSDYDVIRNLDTSISQLKNQGVKNSGF